ncbi:transmembrane protein, putative (macronuclear) [Tetrahymena thermophila SB210]|uniref:Transmembrane protein, putative n=1 Tax=Tetrahymena thermophila (strain SB210) TaxID=312017 RepID=W7XLB5_TETTS|nr:transmembrane protein, putative [Tetrahymena thermophila SB210]EWS75999.1 transmembrane protein, putative [Tetrahymena thermophila SB210]|eukprot:XP_012651517.1 transmembrane protein, putative [Tetrahymena thermophila SB210]
MKEQEQSILVKMKNSIIKRKIKRYIITVSTNRLLDSQQQISLRLIFIKELSSSTLFSCNKFLRGLELIYQFYISFLKAPLNYYWLYFSYYYQYLDLFILFLNAINRTVINGCSYKCMICLQLFIQSHIAMVGIECRSQIFFNLKSFIQIQGV